VTTTTTLPIAAQAGGPNMEGAGVGVPYRARLNERTLLNLPGFHNGAYV
jgi:hypothetical protein